MAVWKGHGSDVISVCAANLPQTLGEMLTVTAGHLQNHKWEWNYMTPEEHDKLMGDIKELRGQTELIDGVEMPKPVTYLKSILMRTGDVWERFELWGMVRDEYARVGQFDKQIAAIREAARELPDEPLPWASLAETLWGHGHLDESRVVIEDALQKAYQKGRFVRYTLGARARIARTLGDSALFVDTLKRLIDDGGQKRDGDVGLESDFIPKGDLSRLDNDLRQAIAVYSDYLNKAQRA